MSSRGMPHPAGIGRGNTPDTRLNMHSDSQSDSRSGSSDLDDYYKEVHDIEQAETDVEEVQEEETKTPDEGEQELLWLEDAGYGHLVSKLEEGRELEDDMMSKETASLTRTQAAAVKRRVETLNATIREKHRQKHKQRNKVDVRKIFDQPTETEVSDYGPQNTPVGPGHRSIKRAEHGSFLKRTHGYSMTNSKSDEPDCQGVQTISIQSKGSADTVTPASRNSGTGSCHPAGGSDSDLSNVNFSIDTASQHSRVGPSMDGGLPNIVQQKDTLGVTRVYDLSKHDTERVRALALIELTALFDTNNISYTRRKTKKRLKDHGIFGVPLATLLEHDLKKNPYLKVPKIFLELVTFLERHGIEEEGILRVPGSQTRIKTLRAEIEAKFYSDQFQWEEVMPNDAAGLFKQFVRELPAPLLTFEYLDAFAQVEKVQELPQKVQALNLLVLLLPDVHRNTLKLLLHFLRAVVEKENLMNLHNVSMIMAPNLFLVASSRRKKGLQESEVRMAAGTANIVRMLVKYQDLLWSVPSFMLAQIRQKYELEQVRKFRDKPVEHIQLPKGIMKLLGRKEKAETCRKPAIIKENDYQEGVIRVLCPHINKYATPIQLDANTCASDVINKFRRRTVAHHPYAEQANGNQMERTNNVKGDLPYDALHLYEVGGNIGERRLDACTSMLALLRVNPNAQWIVRTQPDDVMDGYFLH